MNTYWKYMHGCTVAVLEQKKCLGQPCTRELNPRPPVFFLLCGPRTTMYSAAAQHSFPVSWPITCYNNQCILMYMYTYTVHVAPTLPPTSPPPHPTLLPPPHGVTVVKNVASSCVHVHCSSPTPSRNNHQYPPPSHHPHQSLSQGEGGAERGQLLHLCGRNCWLAGVAQDAHDQVE